MVRRHEEQPVTINQHMRGGEGGIRLEGILTPAEMYEKGRLFSRLTIAPGCSIGRHTHENEMETFYMIKGIAEFDDNGEKVTLRPGDAAYTASGGSHSIANSGAEDVELLALILFN